MTTPADGGGRRRRRPGPARSTPRRDRVQAGGGEHDERASTTIDEPARRAAGEVEPGDHSAGRAEHDGPWAERPHQHQPPRTRRSDDRPTARRAVGESRRRRRRPPARRRRPDEGDALEAADERRRVTIADRAEQGAGAGPGTSASAGSSRPTRRARRAAMLCARRHRWRRSSWGRAMRPPRPTPAAQVRSRRQPRSAIDEADGRRHGDDDRLEHDLRMAGEQRSPP